MTTDRPHRPLTADDYRRVLRLIDALKRIAVDREPGALWEVIADVHDQDEVSRHPLPLEDRVGDMFAATELSFARIVLESHIHHGGTIPELMNPPASRVCQTDGCPTLVPLSYCPSCELDRLEGST